MRELSMSASIRETLSEILHRDEKAFLIGEDIAVYGGAFKITQGFIDEFGPKRVIDTPISEAGIVSIAAGAALMGSRPIIEIMFMDFMALAFDGIINVAAKWQAVYGDEFSMPMIIRSPAGGGRFYGPTHSQSFEGMLLNVPNLVILCPSSPADASALLLAAHEYNGPVIFIEHKALYARKGPVEDELKAAEIGKGKRLLEGEQVSIFSYGRQIPLCHQASLLLQEQGIGVDLIDLRSIKPLDRELILDSMMKTGKGLSVEESPKEGGVGAEISSIVMEDGFDYLEAPFYRLGARESIIPCNPQMEKDCFPRLDEIVNTVKSLLDY
jgi:pyruvate/2-oxoglutarate/acetoin dehydrogenase E1 component